MSATSGCQDFGITKADTPRRTMITVTKENHYESLDIKNWRQDKTNDVIKAGKTSIFVFIFVNPLLHDEA